MYVSVRTIGPGPCEGKHCSATDALTLVYNEARFHHNPQGPNVQAWLCPGCVGRLGARVRRIELGELRGPAEPMEAF